MTVRHLALAGISALLLVCPSNGWGEAAGAASGEATKDAKKAEREAKRAAKEKAAKERKAAAKLSPEELAARQQQMKEKLQQYAASQGKRIESLQAKLQSLNEELAQETVSVMPPSAQMLAMLGGSGKGRRGGYSAAGRRQKMRKVQGAEGEAEKPDPLEVKAPNTEELKAALAAATEAHAALVAAATKQKEELDQTLASLEGGEGEAAGAKGQSSIWRRMGGQGMKDVQEAQSAASKADQALALLKTKLWLAGIGQKLQTDTAKGGAESAQAALDSFLALKAKQTELEGDMAKQAVIFEESLKPVIESLLPKRPEKGAKKEGRQKDRKEGKKKKDAAEAAE